MKNRKLLLVFVILAIGVAGVVFFNMRPRYEDLTGQTFAKLPEMPALVAEFNHGPSPVNSVAFSPVDASLVASAGRDGIIKLWNINNTNDPVTTLKHPVNYNLIHLNCSIGFSPDGKFLVSIGSGTDLILWDVESGNKVNAIKDNFESFVFSPDGNQLATSHYTKTKLWDIRNPKAITEVATLPFNEAKRVNSGTQTVDISPDGKLIAAGYANGTVEVWDLQTKQHVKTLKTSIVGMEFLKFSPDNRFLVSGGSKFSTSLDGYVMWQLPGWQRHGAVQRANIDNLTFSADGKMFALENRDYGGGIAIYATATGAPITSLSSAAWNVEFSGKALSSTAARSMTFSPDGKMLAIGSREGVLRLWRFTPQHLEHATTPADTVRIIYFQPEGSKGPPNITEKLDKSIRKAQQFYADEMERHGFGRKTFTFETDENGKAKIYLLEEQKEPQIPSFDLSNDIWLVVGENVWFPRGIYGGNTVLNRVFEYPIKGQRNKIKGTNHGKIVPILDTDSGLDWKVAAYELKYAFSTITLGRKHTLLYQDELSTWKRFLMRANGRKPWGKSWVQLSKCEAEWLNKNRFFNPNQPFFDKTPTIDLNVFPTDTAGLESYQFEVADEDGIHQVQLFIDVTKEPWIVKHKFQDCRTLNGETQSTVEFEVSNPEINNVQLRMIDMFGNIAFRNFQVRDEIPE